MLSTSMPLVLMNRHNFPFLLLTSLVTKLAAPLIIGLKLYRCIPENINSDVSVNHFKQMDFEKSLKDPVMIIINLGIQFIDLTADKYRLTPIWYISGISRSVIPEKNPNYF